jgi:hypothetical protein
VGAVKMTVKLAALVALAWVGLFCNPAQFWLADLTTGLTQMPATNQQGVGFDGHNLSP